MIMKLLQKLAEEHVHTQILTRSHEKRIHSIFARILQYTATNTGVEWGRLSDTLKFDLGPPRSSRPN